MELIDKFKYLSDAIDSQTNKQLWLDFFSSRNDIKKQKLLNYFDFLMNLKQAAREDFEMRGKRKLKSNEVDNDRMDAQEKIDQLIESEIYPIVSIPKKYWDKEIQELGGIPAKGWDEEVIAGVLGLPPYRGQPEEERILVIAKVPNWQPRITGKLRTFQGVVKAVDKFIPLKDIEVLKNAPQ